MVAYETSMKSDQRIEMKLTVAAIYSNFATHLTNTYGEDAVEQADGYTTSPKGDKMMLKFQYIED